jgi:D-xylose transport system permease protein
MDIELGADQDADQREAGGVVTRTAAEPSGRGAQSSMRRVGRIGGDMLPIVIGLVIVWTYFEIASSDFLSARNLSNLLVQISSTGIITIGIVLILIIGEIDLSVGSVAGVTGAVLALGLVQGFPWWVSIIAMLAVGAGVGLIQGGWIVLFGVPSFIATLAGLLGLYGLQLYLIQTQNADAILVLERYIDDITTTYVPSAYAWAAAVLIVVGNGALKMRRVRRHRRAGLTTQGGLETVVRFIIVSVALLAATAVLSSYRGVPAAAVLFVGLVSIFAWVSTTTPFGRYLYAIGGNANAARRAGINVKRIRLTVFILSGTLAAVGGLVAVSNLDAVDTTIGGGTLLLEAIAAAVIGGVSLFGGRGSVWAAFFGSLVIGSVSNGLDLTGSPSTVKYMVEGLILLAAVTADVASRRGRLFHHAAG